MFIFVDFLSIPNKNKIKINKYISYNSIYFYKSTIAIAELNIKLEMIHFNVLSSSLTFNGLYCLPVYSFSFAVNLLYFGIILPYTLFVNPFTEYAIIQQLAVLNITYLLIQST